MTDPTSSGHADEADHAEHHHDGADPHIWLDPVLVSAAVPEIAEHLISHAGLDSEAVQQCAEEYRQELIESGPQHQPDSGQHSNRSNATWLPIMTRWATSPSGMTSP